jgi:hypothetical protein
MFLVSAIETSLSGFDSGPARATALNRDAQYPAKTRSSRSANPTACSLLGHASTHPPLNPPQRFLVRGVDQAQASGMLINTGDSVGVTVRHSTLSNNGNRISLIRRSQSDDSRRRELRHQPTAAEGARAVS